MNRRSILMVAVNVGLGLSVASAAPTPPMPAAQSAVPVTIKTATQLSDAQQATVRAFIEAQAAKLASANTADQEDARDALIKEADSAATAPYQDLYAMTLAASAQKLLENPDVRVRLNTAVAVGRVAERCQNLRLKSVAMKLAADKAPPVAYWGVKCVRIMLPLQLRSQLVKDDPFLTGLVPAISGELTGPLVQEAYEAYRLNILTDRRSITPEMLVAVIPPMQELMAKRLAMYAKGHVEDPQSETLGTSFLTDSIVWAAQNDAQKVRTVQSLVDLLAGTSAQLAALDTKSPSASIRRDELLQTLKVTGGAVWVLADQIKDANLLNASGYVAQLDKTLDIHGIVQLCDDVIQGLVNTPQFKGKIKRPAAVATAPAAGKK